MFLKNILNYFNLFYIALFILFIYIISFFFLTFNIRKKFFLFIVLIFLFSGIGFYYNLDGIILLFLITELTIVLIFITIYLQNFNYIKINEKSKKYFLFIILSLLSLNYSFFSLKLLKFTNFYSYYNINFNDFFWFYNFFFETNFLITYLLIFIISLYSIFFILLHYNIKNFNHNEKLKCNNITILRKQNMINQINYKLQLRIFQKK